MTLELLCDLFQQLLTDSVHIRERSMDLIAEPALASTPGAGFPGLPYSSATPLCSWPLHRSGERANKRLDWRRDTLIVRNLLITSEGMKQEMRAGNDLDFRAFTFAPIIFTIVMAVPSLHLLRRCFLS